MMKGYNARQDEIVVRCRGLADWYYGCWCHTDSRLTLACLRIRHTQDTLGIPWEGMDGDHACEPLSSFPSISQRMIMATSGKARQHRAILRLCSLQAPPKISNFPCCFFSRPDQPWKMENIRAHQNPQVKVTSAAAWKARKLGLTPITCLNNSGMAQVVLYQSGAKRARRGQG